MQPYLDYDVSCTADNVSKYMFQERKFKAAQQKLKALLANPPKDMIKPEVDNASWSPTIRSITGVKYGARGAVDRGMRDRDRNVGRQVAAWAIQILRTIEEVYDASNISPYYLPSAESLKKFYPPGARDVRDIPALPPSFRGFRVVEWHGSTRDRYYPFLEGTRKIDISDIVDIPYTEFYRNHKWPGYRRGQQRREERRCHKKDEFHFLPNNQRSPEGDLSFNQFVNYIAFTGGVVAKLRGRVTKDRGRSHPKGRCYSSGDQYYPTAGLYLDFLKNWAHHVANISIEDVISEAMKGLAKDLRYFLETYEKDLTPEQTELVVDAIKSAEQESIVGTLSAMSSIGALAGGVFAVVVAAAAAVMVVLVKIVGTAVGGIFCPRYPFRRQIITEGCDPKIATTRATELLRRAKVIGAEGAGAFLSPEERLKQRQREERVQEAGEFWDRYKWWLIGGGALIAGAAVVPLLLKKKQDSHEL